MIAKIALDVKKQSLDSLYDYEIPAHMTETAKIGQRVIAPYGRSNRMLQGIIIELCDSSDYDKLKQISEILDEESPLDENMVDLLNFVKTRYFCTYFDAIKAILPIGIRMQFAEVYSVNEDNEELCREVNLSDNEILLLNEISKHKNVEYSVLAKAVDFECKSMISKLVEKGFVIKSQKNVGMAEETLRQMARLIASQSEIDAHLGKKGNKKHEAVIEILMNGDYSTVAELCYFAGVSRSVISTLERRGIIEVENRRVESAMFHDQIAERAEDVKINLSIEQKIVYDKIINNLSQEHPKTALLHGVTGSGKTLVFMKAIETAIKMGKSAIVLVPEIVLTPQLTQRFLAKFGEKVALIHSKLSNTERRDAWRNIREEKCKIVLGTRSAIFAPVKNLGIIVMDEEHEYAYKSESAPRYHARTVAKYRAHKEGALLLLCSATPSIESYSYAKKGSYELLKLCNRFNESQLPPVTVTSLKEELLSGMSSVTGPTLIDAITQTLNLKKQAILFLNRRGYSTFLNCDSCATVLECENCSVSMTYHNANNLLMCHICGRTAKVPDFCPECNTGQIVKRGIGTQKVEEEIVRLFPEARVLRMDMDTTRYKMSHEEMLSKFAAGEYDILIGTQMVTKGIDFPNVNLVGVLFADSLLFQDDFRAGERAFSLLTQVVGRAGRAKVEGRAIVDSFVEGNRIIEFAKTQNYEEFYENEIAFRKMAVYPPYCDIYTITFTHENENLLEQAAKEFQKGIISEIEQNKIQKIILFPLTKSSVYKANNQYRLRMVLKCVDSQAIRNALKKVQIQVNKHKYYSNVICVIDINPLSGN